MYKALHFGYGRHIWDIRAITLVPSHLRVRESQVTASYQGCSPLIRDQQMSSLALFGSASTLSIKISIFLLYLRLFHVNQQFRHWTYFGILFCVLYTAVYWGISTAIMIECDTPQSHDVGLCTHASTTTLVIIILNVITDFYVLALPIGIVMRLNVKPSRRVGLIAVFSCGLM